MLACLRFFTFIFVVVTFLASLVGLVTNYWVEHSNTHNQGLWYYCRGDVECVHFDIGTDSYNEVPDWYYAVFGLYVISTVLLFVSCCLSGVLLCIKNRKRCYVANVWCLVISWLCLLTMLSVYTRKFCTVIDDNYKWGYSFGVAWLAFILHSVTLFVAIVIILKDRQYNRNQRSEPLKDHKYEAY